MFRARRAVAVAERVRARPRFGTVAIALARSLVMGAAVAMAAKQASDSGGSSQFTAGMSLRRGYRQTSLASHPPLTPTLTLEPRPSDPNLQAEEAGLSSASYVAPSTRQCGMGLCAMAGRATGICEAVCRNETAAELTGLSWQPSGQSDQSQLSSTLCM